MLVSERMADGDVWKSRLAKDLSMTIRIKIFLCVRLRNSSCFERNLMASRELLKASDDDGKGFEIECTKEAFTSETHEVLQSRLCHVSHSPTYSSVRSTQFF